MDSFLQCKFSGIATCPNRTYRADGASSYNNTESQDRIVNYCINDNEGIFLYGIFSGLNGSSVSDFVSERMVSSLGFETLKRSMSEDQVKAVLRQSFLTAESSFLESIDHKIAERAQLLEKISRVLPQSEAAIMYPDTISRLQDLEEELTAGATAVVSLVLGGRLYVGNIGDSRALLCQKDKSGVLRIKQLSKDHTTNDAEELDRLRSLSLDLKGNKLGSGNITRCFGNYFLKGGYREDETLRVATGEPVVCEPYVTSLPIDESCNFLLLANRGLFDVYEHATSSTHSNKDVATMVVEQLMEESDLAKVVGKVVEGIVSIHRRRSSGSGLEGSSECVHPSFASETSSLHCNSSLLIRNFNFRSPYQLEPFSVTPLESRYRDAFEGSRQDLILKENVAGINQPLQFDDQNVTTVDSLASVDQPLDQISGINLPVDPIDTGNMSVNPATFGNQSINPTTNVNPSLDPIPSSSTESSKLSNPSLTQLTLDDEGRIGSYVSFDEYYKLVDDAIANGVIQKSRISVYK